MAKNGPLLCGLRGLLHRPDQVQQSFSRLRLTTPRLNLHTGSHLRPCLVAPTIDSASLEPQSATPVQRPRPLRFPLHKNGSHCLRLPTSLGSNHLL